jgi:hypothetical protein
MSGSANGVCFRMTTLRIAGCLHLNSLRSRLPSLLDRCSTVCKEAELALSPSVELHRPPLNKLPASELRQLGSALHADWLARSDIRSRMRAVDEDIEAVRVAAEQVLRLPSDPVVAQAFCDVLQALGQQLSSLLQAAPYPGTLV